jgi:dipeptidyl aminopeptidase/acylaminoacyl peptidase
VPTGSLPPAGYTVTWDLDGASPSGRLGLTVLPSSDAVSLRARLGKAQPRLRPGSVSTLRFQIDEIERQERRLHPQEVATALRLSLEQLLEDLAAAEAGTDVMAARTGILRRAFASKVDATLQPYSVRIPGNYRATTRYPLLVYLHGSGEDDRDQLTRTWFPDDFILVAPRARGTSNWYTADHAQDDIREAIDDACANYSVDRSRIVLMGFSMGGYGVYRTFLEDPKRYRALAVFSGIPRVPGGGSGAPDLLENESLLAAFRSMPMFVFHGGKDRNCPIEQTRSLVSRLEQAGATVAFHLEEDKGHEAPGAATLSAFHEWIRRIVR